LRWRETQARTGAIGAAALAVASLIFFAVSWLWIVPDFVLLLGVAALLAAFASGFFTALRARVPRRVVIAGGISTA
jgi:hypothetical protein